MSYFLYFFNLQDIIISRGMKKELTLWKRYKEWMKKIFPGKPPQTIEKWDFIMVFQDRYE